MKEIDNIKRTAGWTPIILGIVLIILALAVRVITDNISTSGEVKKSWVSFISDYSSDLILSGFVLISVGLLSISAINGVRKLWQDTISKDLFREIQETAKQTREIVANSTMDDFIESKNIEPTLIREKLPELYAKAYGPHCADDAGLYKFTHNKLAKFFCPETPHRSNYNQTVTVKNSGNDDGSIIWQEVCSYRIHAVALDPKYTKSSPEKIPYKFSFASIIKAAELGFDGNDPKYHLVVKICRDSTTQENVFDSRTDLKMDANGKVTPSKQNDTVKVIHNGDSLEIRLAKNIELINAWTDIEIKETSCILDDYFISRRNEPTCGARITMLLPDNWNFELISFGHPDDWTIHQYPPNTLSAWTNGWVLPGITFYCKWNKPPLTNTAEIKKEG